MNVTIFLSGITMATFTASGIFFLRFWVNSRDRFFLFFSFACFILAVERIIALNIPANLAADPKIEKLFFQYFVRLLAFVAIAIAIVDKNRNASKGNGPKR